MSLFIDQQPRQTGLGYIAQQLGEGLGGGLQSGVDKYFVEKQNKQKAQGLAPIFEQLGMEKEKIDQLLGSGLSPEQLIPIADLAQKQQQYQQKQQAELEEKEGPRREVGNVINEMVDILEGGTLGKANAMNQLFAYGRHNRGLYDELALRIEKELAGMVGKGALSKARFDYLLKNLPKSSYTDATNRSKLQGLAKIFGTTIDNPDFWKKVGKYQSGAGGSEGSQEGKPSLEDIFK